MITILVGISGSGKTTWALDKLGINKNLIRINRDDLRKTLFGIDQTDVEYYNRSDLRDCEKLISEISEQIIYDALNKGKDIILDNTHLQKKYITEIIRKFNHLDSIELVFMHDQDIKHRDIAKKRLFLRFEGQVEKTSYLERQWKDFVKLKKDLNGERLLYPQTSPAIAFNKNLPPTYAFDLDGTLALKGDRDIFDDSKLYLDTEIKEVGEILRSVHKRGYRVIFLSGRQDSCYDSTKQWLIDNNLWTDTSEMFMRKSNDTRPDYIVKEELIINEIHPKYNLFAVIDDRLQVSREYYRLGIFTLNVNQGLKQF